jgi:hypothetical protein
MFVTARYKFLALAIETVEPCVQIHHIIFSKLRQLDPETTGDLSIAFASVPIVPIVPPKRL